MSETQRFNLLCGLTSNNNVIRLKTKNVASCYFEKTISNSGSILYSILFRGYEFSNQNEKQFQTFQLTDWSQARMSVSILIPLRATPRQFSSSWSTMHGRTLNMWGKSTHGYKLSKSLPLGFKQGFGLRRSGIGKPCLCKLDSVDKRDEQRFRNEIWQWSNSPNQLVLFSANPICLIFFLLIASFVSCHPIQPFYSWLVVYFVSHTTRLISFFT